MKHFAAVMAALSLCFSGAAVAQSADASRYPARAIRVIVPFGPGGPAHRLARAAASKLTETLGQQVVV